MESFPYIILAYKTMLIIAGTRHQKRVVMFIKNKNTYPVVVFNIPNLRSVIEQFEKAKVLGKFVLPGIAVNCIWYFVNFRKQKW